MATETTRIDHNLSDLFFNTNHDGFDELHRIHKANIAGGGFTEPPSLDEQRDSLNQDAAEFIERIEALGFATSPTVSELVDDFLGRL